MANLISFTHSGLYCEKGNFYIDPWKPVEKAIITHGHSDHACPGHHYYLCHRFTKPILQLRLGDHNFQTMEWNDPVEINGVKVSLHPAGHIIGSSQIRLEYRGEIWVVSGDYKTEDDGISGRFEPISCHVFITESTFGLPVYKWKPQQEIFSDMTNWISKNKEKGETSILLAYSLGKAQRVIQALKETTQTLFAHGAVYQVQQTLINAGWSLQPVVRITPDMHKQLFQQSVIIAPSGSQKTPWMKRFEPFSVGICSGWMQVRGHVRRSNADAGFVMSDHADWNGLIDSVKATGAERIFVTHGFQAAFSRYLNEENIAIAAEVSTPFGNEEEALSSLQELSTFPNENT